MFTLIQRFIDFLMSVLRWFLIGTPEPGQSHSGQPQHDEEHHDSHEHDAEHQHPKHPAHKNPVHHAPERVHPDHEPRHTPDNAKEGAHPMGHSPVLSRGLRTGRTPSLLERLTQTQF